MLSRATFSSLAGLALAASFSLIALVGCGGSGDLKSNQFATAMVDVISAAKKGSGESDSQGRTADDTVKAVLGNDPKACSLFTADGLRHGFDGSDPLETCREELADRDSQEIEITGLASDDRGTATATATAGSNTWQVDLVKEEDGWRVTTTTKAETATTENGDTTSTQERTSEAIREPTRTESTTTARRGDQERGSEAIREPTDTQDNQPGRPEASQPGDEDEIKEAIRRAYGNNPNDCSRVFNKRGLKGFFGVEGQDPLQACKEKLASREATTGIEFGRIDIKGSSADADIMVEQNRWKMKMVVEDDRWKVEDSVSPEVGSATRNLHESTKLVDAITETPIEEVGQPITFRALSLPASTRERVRINEGSELVLKVERVDSEGVNRDGQKEIEAAYCNPDGTVSSKRVKYSFTNIEVSFEYRGQSRSTVSFGAVAYDVDGVLWPDIGRLGRRSSLTNSRPLDKSGNITTNHRRFQLASGEKHIAFLTVAVPEDVQLRQVDITPVVVVGENATAFAPSTGVWAFS